MSRLPGSGSLPTKHQHCCRASLAPSSSQRMLWSHPPLLSSVCSSNRRMIFVNANKIHARSWSSQDFHAYTTETTQTFPELFEREKNNDKEGPFAQPRREIYKGVSSRKFPKCNAIDVCTAGFQRNYMLTTVQLQGETRPPNVKPT